MNVKALIEKVVGDLDDKKRWRNLKERRQQLPASHRATVDALERYLMRFGAISKGDVLVAMTEDLTDLFEQAAFHGTPIRQIVGDDPVEFAEDFLRNYSEGQWVNKERARLIEAVVQAAAQES